MASRRAGAWSHHGPRRPYLRISAARPDLRRSPSGPAEGHREAVPLTSREGGATRGNQDDRRGADHPARMIRLRLNAIGAAVFALATLALPTFALPHKRSDVLIHRDTRGQLQDVNLA